MEFQIAGMLFTSFLFDVADGRLQNNTCIKVACLLIVIGGVAIGSQAHFEFNLFASFCLLSVFISGAGWVLQARCNVILAEAFGSSSRATSFSGFVTIFGSLLIDAYVYIMRGTLPETPHLSELPLWLLAGLQTAFYFYSISLLPRLIGYTSLYIIALFGKLTTSGICDACGAMGTQLPFTLGRVLSLLIVFVGAAVDAYFSVVAKKPEASAAKSVDGYGTMTPDDAESKPSS